MHNRPTKADDEQVLLVLAIADVALAAGTFVLAVPCAALAIRELRSPRPVRTCVRMAPRPWRPAKELEHALKLGNLNFAMMLAREVQDERRGRPLDLPTALLFLPVVAEQEPENYDAWALRWLSRWAGESRGATLDKAVDVAASLAALPMGPEAIETIRQALG